MTNTRKPRRSKAHDFSALSTSIGVALTLALWGALVAGALLVQDLKADWMSSMRVELVLVEPPSDGRSVEQWIEQVQADDAVTQVVYVDPDSAARELESELGEPFMDFLGASPLPAVLELALSPQWMGELGLAGLIEKEAQWQGLDGVARVEYPRALLAQLDRGFQDWTYPGLFLVAVLMAIVVAQIMNVVRLSVFGRRFLIRSMELVGAPPHRIRRPFITEAMGYGAVGALLAYAGLVAALVGARSFLPDAMATWGAKELGIILVSQMAVGLVLTGLSARWAVSRYFGARLDKLM
ncbi:MAG: hypothetical protein L7S67_09235 [Flavobacteriales bacterium]|nr:hypothetical protein [Flavobacteriales bacterium]